ncbi:MAG: hypothetical protein M0Z31_14600 [Clostridia bacterium]|nr:hypothetical protein [Clostridia bacterium]
MFIVRDFPGVAEFVIVLFTPDVAQGVVEVIEGIFFGAFEFMVLLLFIIVLG